MFFMNDNPVTLEAVCYGFAVGVMIMSVFYWFKCFNAVMSSDKFIYLFGRVIPKLALPFVHDARLYSQAEKALQRKSTARRRRWEFTPPRALWTD